MKPAEFRRVYHSKERIEFVKNLPCVACGKKLCHNHHIQSGGMRRKADYIWIVPLCTNHHFEVHARGRITFEIRHRVRWIEAAKRTEEKWQKQE